MYFAQPIKAHVIGQSLNESIVMSYYLIPPINQASTGLIYFHNCNDRLRLANQKPNTNYISTLNVCNIEIANLPAKNYTFLNVNISASPQFMNLRVWELIFIVLYAQAKFWANLKFCQYVTVQGSILLPLLKIFNKWILESRMSWFVCNHLRL